MVTVIFMVDKISLLITLLVYQDFEQDIKYHSRLMKNDLNKSIDSYVKMKDKIGEAE